MQHWADHTIFWHVYPLGFGGAPIREGRTSGTRLSHLEPWLDYLVELGCSGLLLGPIFQSATHGYDTLDFYAIDDRLGSDAEFDSLIAACHERGIRVVLDGVFSHVSDQFGLLRDDLASGPENQHSRLFDIEWDAEGGPRSRVFEGHGSLARFNHTSDETVSLVRDVMLYWMRRGADGWRLDAAYSVDPAFWARVLPAVRAEFPDAWVLGEMIHGDYSGYVKTSGIDTVTQYELWKAIWSSLKDENFHELAWSLKRHNEFLNTFTPQTFVGNHDVTRIATTVGIDKAVLALAILMCVGGIPSIYYGDEQGYTGLKIEGWGGDDQVRPVFPELPEHLSALGAEAFEAHQALIGLRRRNPWLVRARTEALDVTNTSVVLRSTADDHWLELQIDLEADTAEIRDASGRLWER